jgi:parallel beta-helix repeat protein
LSRRALLILLCLGTASFAAAFLVACGEGTDGDGDGEGSDSAKVIRVPQDKKTIQEAVDDSEDGDLVLVSPGTYAESVTVEENRPNITIRGTDRNAVILDGQRASLVNGITIRADGVAVENLTVRHYAVNGVVWSPSSEYRSEDYLEGWRGSYITAHNNGLYGVYAVRAHNGRFDHIYASGHPDSGIYVGQCTACAAVVTESVAERNAVGYKDTNASGVEVTKLELRDNRIGASISSNLKEAEAPQSGGTFSGNVVEDNDNAQAPAGGQGFGAGIVVSGGADNTIEENRVSGQPVGIAVVNADDKAGGFRSTGNSITGNQAKGNGWDLYLAVGADSGGNCFAGNGPRRTFPPKIESKTPCGQNAPLAGIAPALPGSPPGVPYLRVQPPGAQQSMPGDVEALPSGPAGAGS